MADEKERRTPLPQLVVTPTGFRVYDPAMVARKKDLFEWRGKFERQAKGLSGAAAILAMVWVGATASALLGASLLSYSLWFLAGAAGGLLLAGIAWGIFAEDPEATYRETHRGAEPHVEVTDDTRVREVCTLAEEVAETTAWQDGVIDPDRRLASIVWSTAGGAPSDEASADIDRTLTNLRELRRIAWDLDHRREHGEAAVDGRSATREPTVRARSLSDEMLEHGRTVRDIA